jgi:hypothetical protein
MKRREERIMFQVILIIRFTVDLWGSEKDGKWLGLDFTNLYLRVL